MKIKWIALLLMACMAIPAIAGAAEIPAELPRNETLYFGGLQWGTVVSWNPFTDSPNNAMVNDGQASRRLPVREALYMYNALDGQLSPLLASGAPQWNDDMTEITVKLNTAAHFSDGSPLTAEDVAYTWATHVKYGTSFGIVNSEFIADVIAADAETVLIKAALNEEGKTKNPLEVINFLPQVYVISKSWIEKLEERAGGDADALKNDTGEDCVTSGPYAAGFYSDDQKVVLLRDDNYWGQDASMWGKLPVPKYLAHVIYPDNAAIQVAFAAGEIDVNQQFIENVQNLWEKDNLPISTYMDEPPYGICLTTPTAWFNFNNPILADNLAIRKAIAIAVDYDQINANAMTGQSPTFAQAPRSLMNPTEGEQAMYNHEAVAHLQWVGNDIEGAKALLDEAGIVDSDGDGWREIDGEKLSFNAVCPLGWTDWMASMEIVAAAGKNIGIEITTLFPDWAEEQTVFTDGTQTQYDIFMWGGDASGLNYPWMRVRNRMSSEYIGLQGNWSGNWGQYVNPRADEIIKAIPYETDSDALKALYTEAVEIYLTDVPSFALMYRPEMFHAVNESVWTSYPEAGDGLNIPPTCLLNGYGIAGLYNLTLVDAG
jgi:peptide/nickel transport system substrate-binding protein